MALVTSVKFLGEKLKATIPLFFSRYNLTVFILNIFSHFYSSRVSARPTPLYLARPCPWLSIKMFVIHEAPHCRSSICTMLACTFEGCIVKFTDSEKTIHCYAQVSFDMCHDFECSRSFVHLRRRKGKGMEAKQVLYNSWYSQSHVGRHFPKSSLKARSSNVYFLWNVAIETFEL